MKLLFTLVTIHGFKLSLFVFSFELKSSKIKNEKYEHPYKALYTKLYGQEEMKLRRIRGVRFVRRAPTKSGQDAELRVTRMAFSQVLWWHSHVQPIIDGDPSRADRDWNWLLYVSFATLTGELLDRQPAGYTVGIVVREKGHIIPCALVQLMGNFPALDDHTKRSAFVWFMSTAPAEALMSIAEHPIPKSLVPKKLGKIALDVAVTHSLNQRRRGRVALYADREGGDNLTDWYRSCGMEALSADLRLPPVLRRIFKPSDGRYFYLKPDSAMKASRALDYLR